MRIVSKKQKVHLVSTLNPEIFRRFIFVFICDTGKLRLGGGKASAEPQLNLGCYCGTHAWVVCMIWAYLLTNEGLERALPAGRSQSYQKQFEPVYEGTSTSIRAGHDSQRCSDKVVDWKPQTHASIGLRSTVYCPELSGAYLFRKSYENGLGDSHHRTGKRSLFLKISDIWTNLSLMKDFPACLATQPHH